MNIPTEFRGQINFYWNTEYNWLSVCDQKLPADKYIFLGNTEILTVGFVDFRQKAVEALEKQIEQERAESRRRIDILQGKIQSLLAIEAVA